MATPAGADHIGSAALSALRRPVPAGLHEASRAPVSAYLLIAGHLLSLAFSLVLAVIWATAFLSPSKSVTVTVDSANEAVPELFLLSVVLPWLFLSGISTVRRTLRGVPSRRP